MKGRKRAPGHEKDMAIEQDQAELRQVRYILMAYGTQFLGPQIEDITAALSSVTIECNSSALCLLLRGASIRKESGLRNAVECNTMGNTAMSV